MVVGRTWPVVTVAAALLASSGAAEGAENLFANGSFEMGRGGWNADKGGGTVASFQVDGRDAVLGRHSALVTVGKVEEWGVQFGQRIPAGKRGRTYTFAAVAKAVGKGVGLDLQIERQAKPWDRAARGATVRLAPGTWTELHVTFTVGKDFPQGWFAYVSCTQPNCTFRVDALRLYEGTYVPYDKLKRDRHAAAGVRLFDTARSADKPLSADDLGARTGWKPVAPGTTRHAFAGDAVLMNDRLAVALRRKGHAAEVYSLRPAPARLRARLSPAGAAARGIAVTGLAGNTPAGVALDATFAADGTAWGLGLKLAIGQPFVETQPRGGAGALRVEAPCRFVILPDFFADDIVLDATELPGAKAELPADHLLLHLADDRDAIVAAVRDKPERDIRLTLTGKGPDRRARSTEVPFGGDGKVHIAVLSGEGIWHAHDVAAADRDRVLALDWAQPFAAAWRCDWRRHDGLTDSWEMILQQPDGRFRKHSPAGSTSTLPPNRKRWTTVLGSFPYPCWIDRGGRGHLQPLRRGLRFEGPAVVYPIGRAGTRTPLDAFTVVDVVRATLGVGPCEYVLDVEGQRSRSHGRATCSTRDTLNPIYKAGRQRAQGAKIDQTLKEVIVFIRFIRGRIEQYVAFGHEIRGYFDEQRKAHPELTRQLDELDALARRIDARFAARQDKIKTPAYAEKLTDEFRRTLMNYEGPDAYPKCRRFTTAWVEIGSNQDELVGECRWAVKMLRQRAALLAATEPRLSAVAREIRRRSQRVLRSPAGHEGASH